MNWSDIETTDMKIFIRKTAKERKDYQCFYRRGAEDYDCLYERL